MTSEETENLWKELEALREELKKERERSRTLELQLELLKESSPTPLASQEATSGNSGNNE